MEQMRSKSLGSLGHRNWLVKLEALKNVRKTSDCYFNQENCFIVYIHIASYVMSAKSLV